MVQALESQAKGHTGKGQEADKSRRVRVGSAVGSAVYRLWTKCKLTFKKKKKIVAKHITVGRLFK